MNIDIFQILRPFPVEECLPRFPTEINEFKIKTINRPRFSSVTLLLIVDETLDAVKVFWKPAGLFEYQLAAISFIEWLITEYIQINKSTKVITIVVIDNLHGSVLFDPKFSYNHVVNTAVNVGPTVELIPSRTYHSLFMSIPFFPRINIENRLLLHCLN